MRIEKDLVYTIWCGKCHGIRDFRVPFDVYRLSKAPMDDVVMEDFKSCGWRLDARYVQLCPSCAKGAEKNE